MDPSTSAARVDSASTSGPTVSVVIAAYNAAATIHEAIESAAHQSYPPVEVIVVDDGSTDGTAAVAEASGLASAVLRQRNQGPSRARNTGIEVATGAWIALLDADDAWHADKLRSQIQLAAAHPDLSIIATDWVRTRQALSATPTAPPSWFAYRDLLVLNRFQTSTVLARREVLDRIGGFDPQLDGVEDWDCWLRASLEGPVALVHAPLVLYRDSPGGVSKDLRRLRRGALRILARERERQVLEEDDLEVIVAWHLERLLVGEVLAHDVPGALGAIRDLRRAPLSAHVVASRELLAPFLQTRLTRRLGRAAAR